MITKLAAVTIYVRDQEEALRFYTEKLGFVKIDDIQVPGGMRWLTVAPKKDSQTTMILQRAEDSGRARAMAKPLGSNSTWVLFTDDCKKSYEEMKGKGVKFVQEPKQYPHGIEADFEDLYGNSFAMVQPAHGM